MHELFTDWYLTADPNASRDVIVKRWTAVYAAARALTTETSLSLAAFVVRPSLEVPVWFQDLLKSHDEVMRTRNIEAELRVLAAITIRLLVEPQEEAEEGEDEEDEIDPGVAIVASFALLSGSFGMPVPGWLSEHLQALASFLSSEGAEKRNLSGARRLETVTPASVNESLVHLGKRIDLAMEVNTYLWWFVTGYSGTMAAKYSSIVPSVAALAMSKDLSLLMETTPPLPEIETLLLHAVSLLKDGETAGLSLKSHIGALGKSAEDLLEVIPEACRLLCPLGWAVGASVREKAWISEFEKTFGFKAAATFSSQQIALQYFRELSFIRSLSSTNG